MTNTSPVGRELILHHWLEDQSSSPTNASSHKSYVSTLAEVARIEMDDPWNWTTDRIVRELCTDERSWQHRRGKMPDALTFEAALRAQDITGDILLVELDDPVMKEDLGLKAIQGRAFVRGAIEELRARSLKYQDWWEKHDPGNVASYYSRSIQEHSLQQSAEKPRAGFATPFNQASESIQAKASSPLALSLHSEGSKSLEYPANNILEPHTPDNRIWGHGNTHWEIDKISSKHSTDIMREEWSQCHDALVPQDQEPYHSTGVVPLTNGKKRKRIAPTLVTSVLDPNRERTIPTDADNVVMHNPSIIKPGTVFVDENGRKRVMPIHQEAPKPAEPHTLVNRLKSKAKGTRSPNGREYLGKDKLLVDNIFYRDIDFGKDIAYDSDAEISLVSGGVSAGRRLYVHGIMKHFLQVDQKSIVRGGKHFSAVLPYVTRLAPKYHDPSFTLYSKATNGSVQAKRERLPAWPELDPEALPNALSGNEPVLAGFTGSYEEWDPSYLEKYHFIKGGDIVLPLYGESDEENEFDPDTWAEIEAERGNLPKLEVALKRQHISAAEISQAIDEGIADLKAKWKRLRFPKLQRKAWRIWIRSRRENNKRQRIKVFEARISHINDRIFKMSAEIAKDAWTSQQQVRSQTRIMETSIFELEDLMWEISVLASKAIPQKLVVPKTVLMPQKTSAFDEDGESLESSEACSSDDDDLDGFIIQDENDSSSVAHELDLATDQDDEASEMDIIEDFEISNTVDRSPPGRAAATSRRRLNMKGEASLPMHQEKDAVDDIIDLTILSSSSDRDVVDLVTPTKKLLTSTSARRVKIKLDLQPKAAAKATIAISDTDDRAMSGLTGGRLPSLSDPEAISSKIDGIWMERRDSARLLVGILYRELEPEEKVRLIEFLRNMPEKTLWSRILNAAYLLSGKDSRMKGLDAQSLSTLRLLVRMLLIYIDCKPVAAFNHDTVLQAGHITKIRNSKANLFRNFYRFCCKLGAYLWPRNGISSDEEKEQEMELLTGGRRRSRLSTTSDDGTTENDSPRKRRKPLHEDASARDLRIQDRERQAEQEERRQRLRAKLAESGNIPGVDPSRIIINEGKFDDQGYVYVNDYIGRRIKPHQVSGVQFMWSQVVTAHKVMHGCLLAHTMGLGKTMQSITLLIAIAEASASNDETVRAQVPPSLRVSKTLIICPAGLIDNWMDEFLMWTPKDLLGELRKIDATIKTVKARLSIIDDWSRGGGILIIGYDMFRTLIHNGMRKDATSAPLSEEQHEKVKQQLLEGPNIIIADEAHKMKNATSQLTIATSKFRSMTRIALTGSPLANNVEEYHTMIEWVAPNYLGPIAEFRQKYVHPIQDGLFFDSTPAERRKSLKMLGVLKEDLSPKVHRADMSVLRNDLPPKTEFVIFLHLSDLQKKAYTLYVRSMLPGAGRITQSTLWHWLAILSLLCNHPSCFKGKLTERKEDAVLSQRAAIRPPSMEEDDVNVWKSGVSEELVRQELALLDQEPDLSSFDLSNKVKILCQILDASRTAGDKVLVFSSSIPTLDYLQSVCEETGRKWARLDGSTQVAKRQGLTKAFNTGDKELYLISTTAGGLGLNLPSANRVVIFDFKWNPIAEEQAVGRAYRIGQKKRVFVYRFVVAGTFEEVIHNKAIFKMQLSQRVVDKKTPVAWAKKNAGEFLFEPKDVEEKDLDGHINKDPDVLDAILAEQKDKRIICSIIQNDTFEQVADDLLTAEDRREIEQLLSDEQLKRSNPVAYRDLALKRQRAELHLDAQLSTSRQALYLTGRPVSTPQTIPTSGYAHAVTLSSGKSNASLSSTSTQTSNHTPQLTGQSSSNTPRIKGQTILPPVSTTRPSYTRPELEPVRGTGTRVREEDRVESAPTPIGTPASGSQKQGAAATSTNGASNPKSKSSHARSPPAQMSSSSSAKQKSLGPDTKLSSALQRAERSGVSSKSSSWQDTVSGILKAVNNLISGATDRDNAIIKASEEIDKRPATGLALLKKELKAGEFVQGVISQMRARQSARDTPKDGLQARMLEAMGNAAGPKSRQIEDALAKAQIDQRRAARRAQRHTPSQSQGSALPEWALQDIKTRSRSHRSRQGTPSSSAKF